MKISLNWLKDYIPGLKYASIDSLIDKMVSVGLDIEGVENEGEVFKNFVVGEVIEKKKHPNADKLSLCKVNVGDKILSIVCGAPNVDVEQKVCVATIGAIIPNGEFEIKRSKIRGELSEGMICSEKELNISENQDGILVLEPNAKTGQSFAEYMKADDIVFEIGITPNRGDLFSHIGVAREVAALYNLKVELPEIKIDESEINTSDLIRITIENKDFCKRFTGRVIQNVEIKESPEWLKKHLKAVGLRPRNNIVDITNFVMFETGQPLHAFDYDKIREKEIIVRTAKEGDKFVTLDSKERILNSNSLMVCDGEGYSGIAGLMGGELSEITSDTKNVFLESAYFDPVSVRKNSKKLGLQTDASQRFERGVDINFVEYASLRATQLIGDIAGGKVTTDLYDVYPVKFDKQIVGIRTQKANDVIGIKLTDDEILDLLSKVEIKFIENKNGMFYFEIPEFRRLDLEREIDLVEEIARIYGYDNIPEETNFNVNVLNSKKYDNLNWKLMKEITAHLIGRGFNQIFTNPHIHGKDIHNSVKLAKSDSIEMSALRTNLIYGMMKVIRNNFNNSGKDISLKLFEAGRVFSDDGKKFTEDNRLILALAGKKDSLMLYGGDNDFDIFDIKGEVEILLSKLDLENYRLFYYNDNVLNGVKLDVSFKGELIGTIYKADSSLRKEFEIDSDIYFAEFYLDLLFKKVPNSKYYAEISRFPPVKRDLAIVIDRKISFEELKDSIIKSGGEKLMNLELFDMYVDEKLGNNKKSLAFSLEFGSNEKTLTDNETNSMIEKIVNSLEKNFDAKLRS